jgi:cysteine desulfurase
MLVYLDNAATTKVCDEAAAAAVKAMTDNYGNPSSSHIAGRRARAALDEARSQVAAALGCSAAELVFTSGGTESNNWALMSGCETRKRHGKHIISSEAEHDAVRKLMGFLSQRGYEVTLLKPGPDGTVSAEAVASALREDTALVSLMLVNNETGGVTDIRSISQTLKKRGSRALFHCDAVQGFLKVPFTPKELGVDLLSVSGHKVHAPKGVGALYIRSGLRLQPLLLGGGQEGGLRSGTEALPQIAAFGEAARLGKAAMAQAVPRMAALRKLAADRLAAEIPDVVIHSGGACHILGLSLPGYRSEVLMNVLETQGICVSKSSACKRGARSHVLEAMGLPARVIDGSLRIGLSRYTTREEINIFCDSLRKAREELLPSL